MKRIPTTIFFLTALHYANAQTDFERQLGPDKSGALKLMVESYDEFLRTHYSPKYEGDEQTFAYLNVIEVLGPYYNDHLMIDSLDALLLLQKFEDSGLRKDIWLYPSEEYSDRKVIKFYNAVKDSLQQTGDFEAPTVDPGSITEDFGDLGNSENQNEKNVDQIRLVSQFSSVYAAIYRSTIDNDFVKRFCENAIVFQGIRSPRILAFEMIKHEDLDPSNYFVKVIIVMEIYYHVLYERIYNETAPNTGYTQ